MIVNWQIYAFEDALEKAVGGWLAKNGINDPVKQRDEKADGSALKTPRVEVKAIFGGYPSEHYFVNAAGNRWLDIGAGTLFLKVVTRREPGEISHAMLRGQCRGVMQFAAEISALMPLHKIEKIIEQPTAINIDEERKHDISALQFSVWQRIRPEAFDNLTT